MEKKRRSIKYLKSAIITLQRWPWLLCPQNRLFSFTFLVVCFSLIIIKSVLVTFRWGALPLRFHQQTAWTLFGSDWARPLRHLSCPWDSSTIFPLSFVDPISAYNQSDQYDSILPSCLSVLCAEVSSKTFDQQGVSSTTPSPIAMNSQWD